MHEYWLPCSEMEPEDAGHMMVAVAILTYHGGKLKALMFESEREPFKDKFVVPTSFVPADRTIAQVARDLLFHDLKMGDIDIEHVATLSCPERDPRGRTWCCAYVGAARYGDLAHLGRINDAELVDVRLDEFGDVRCSVGGLPIGPGFDHAEIIAGTLYHARDRGLNSMLPYLMLDEQFTLGDLEDIAEKIAGVEIATPSFRKSVVKRALPDGGEIVATQFFREGEANRPARLYYIKRGKQTW